jgi:hypothetical protein
VGSDLRFCDIVRNRRSDLLPTLTASASIRNPQTLNRYSYVLNSPYKHTDPLGLLPLTSAGACGNFCRNWDGGAIGWTQNYDSGHRNGWELAEMERQAQQQRAIPPSDIPEDAMCNPSHPYWNTYFASPAPPSQVEPNSSIPEIANQNAALSSVLTDGNGVVRTNRGETEIYFNGGQSHFRLPDGQIITVHVYGDESGLNSAKLFVPDGFEATYSGGRSNTVSAYNRRTGDFIIFLHVKGVNSQRELDRNMRTKNEAGSRYIGLTGGPGGNTPGYIHSCIKIFKGYEAYRRFDRAYRGDGNVDPNVYSDFRKYIK